MTDTCICGHKADAHHPGVISQCLRCLQCHHFTPSMIFAMPNEEPAVPDPINHPSHYTGFSNGAEVIDITENLSFNRGNAVKYLARAGRKDPARELEDLKKARWYVEREIARTEHELADSEPAQVVIEKPIATKIQFGDAKAEAEYWTAGRDQLRNIRLNEGTGRLVAEAGNTRDEVKSWLESATPGSDWERQYQAALDLLDREAAEKQATKPRTDAAPFTEAIADA